MNGKHERTTSAATVTFWCIATDPGGAPISLAILSPIVIGVSHQPSPQARIPRAAHVSAYSFSRTFASSGIGPSEWLIR